MACLQKARLLDAKTKSGMYMLEYTVQKPEEDEPRHFLSAVSLGYNGRCYSCCYLYSSFPAADEHEKSMCCNFAMEGIAYLVPLGCKNCRLTDVCTLQVQSPVHTDSADPGSRLWRDKEYIAAGPGQLQASHTCSLRQRCCSVSPQLRH